jgi:ADP-ribose pyrophosphatase
LSETTIHSEYLYKGRILNLRVDRVSLPGGRESKREIVEHPGAVGIIALDAQKHVVLVRQYRKAIERTTLEIPAGTLEAGESPLLCAQRELREETGFVAKLWQPVLGYYSAAGFCDEYLHLFHATDLVHVGGTSDEDESLTVVPMNPSEAWDMAERGEMPDAKTIIALLWLQLHNDGATA